MFIAEESIHDLALNHIHHSIIIFVIYQPPSDKITVKFVHFHNDCFYPNSIKTNEQA